MILADSTVVIDFVRSKDPKMLHIIVTSSAAICGITRAEVLNGARNPAHRAKLITDLSVFGQVVIPEPLWDDVGDNLSLLRRKGVNVPFQDVVIATVAIANDIELWNRDKQFLLIQIVLPQLRLFV